MDVDDHGDDGEIEVTGANIRSPSVATGHGSRST